MTAIEERVRQALLNAAEHLRLFHAGESGRLDEENDIRQLLAEIETGAWR